MKRLLRKVFGLMNVVGVDPLKVYSLARGLPWYYRDRRELRRQGATSAEHFDFGKAYPILNERSAQGGSASGHYFHQDLLVARRIFENSPQTHVDVGSRVDGFVAHVASFRLIKVIDIRPNAARVRNIEFVTADFMSEAGLASLAEFSDSLSCLHALEHFGLGRYGDPIQWEGHLRGLDNLHRMLKRGGKLYLSVPIGKQRIEFNAHRVFSVHYLLEKFEGRFRMDHFSYVDDRGDLHEDMNLAGPDIESNFGCNYGCGIFEMTKI